MANLINDNDIATTYVTDMKITFFSAASQAWALVRRDPLVLVPNILLLMTIQLITVICRDYLNWSAAGLLSHGVIGKIAGLQWLLDLSMNALVVLMVQQLLAGSVLDIRQLLHVLGRHLPRLILITAPIGLLFWILVWWSIPPSLEHLEKLPPLQILALCVAGFFSLILSTLPPIILNGNFSFTATYTKLFHLIRPHFLRVSLFILMAFNVGLLVMLVSLVVGSIPTIGESVLGVIVQGAGFGFIYVTWIVFYQGLTAEPLGPQEVIAAPEGEPYSEKPDA